MSETTKGEGDSLDPQVTDAPEAIWLVYGDIDRTDTHASCCRHGEVTWCEDAQFATDVRYVRADKFNSLSAEVSALRAELEAVKAERDRMKERLEFRGSWPPGAHRAFVEGCSWALWRFMNATPYSYERDLMNAEAIHRFGPVSDLQEQLEAWRFTPVSERLPETDCRVLVLYQAGKSGSTRAMFARYSGGRWRFVDDRSKTRISERVTHWMPGCWCEACDLAANGGLRTRMSLCPTCHDKRCARAKHHYAACEAEEHWS